MGTWICPPSLAPGAPSTRNSLMVPTSEYLVIDFVEHWVILMELPCKRHSTFHHPVKFCHVQEMRLHLWRIIPHHVPQVAVYGCVLEIRGIAHD